MGIINKIMKEYYNRDVLSLNKLSVGAGSNTYEVVTTDGNYILKNPSASEMNNPTLEPELCSFLLSEGFPVSRFIKNTMGEYITNHNNELYHLQKYITGVNYYYNESPDWLLDEMAATLAKIHHSLKVYPALPEGIGENFFKYMTPNFALKSYMSSLNTAIKNTDKIIEQDLNYRIQLMSHFPEFHIDIHELTCGNTHGDYFISQIIAGKDSIAGIIDWTTACRHPYIFEIFRSFIYTDSQSKEGTIVIERLISYIKNYLKYNELSYIDIIMMPKIYYYQISVCDYYGQYYNSDTDNRDIYLHQACFSTKLMKWFEENLEGLLESLHKNFSYL